MKRESGDYCRSIGGELDSDGAEWDSDREADAANTLELGQWLGQLASLSKVYSYIPTTPFPSAQEQFSAKQELEIYNPTFEVSVFLASATADLIPSCSFVFRGSGKNDMRSALPISPRLSSRKNKLCQQFRSKMPQSQDKGYVVAGRKEMVSLRKDVPEFREEKTRAG